MKYLNYAIMMIMIILTFSGCGNGVYTSSNQPSKQPIQPTFKNVIIHAVSYIELKTTQMPAGVITNPSAQYTNNMNVSVTNNASQTMTLGTWNNPSAQTPTSSTTLIDFGNVTIASLFDNNLNVCTSNPSPHKCTTAGFSAYMLTNPGLVNSSDSTQVMPIDMSGPLTSLTVLSITSPGLYLETISIQNGHNTVKLNDFGASSNTTFDVQGDFTNVGSGSYTGTLEVVFFLAD